MDDQKKKTPTTMTIRAHVLIFPMPLQGHVVSMLKLAELLCLGGLNVTFIVTRKIHSRLHHVQYPGFCFEVLPDEMYEGGVRSEKQFSEFFDSLKLIAKPFIKALIIRSSSDRGENIMPPIKSMIADGIMKIVFDLGEEIGVPVFAFRTVSSIAFWAFFCIPQLVEAGDLPFTGNDMDVPVENVKGMEQILRRRDLPSFCHVYDLNRLDFKTLNEATQLTPRAHGLILNTFDDLEGLILSHIRNRCPNVYTIGPVHALLKAQRLLTKVSSSTSSASLLKQDINCLEWLDKQPSKSVIYVSFGSIVTMTSTQLLEFWHGLVNSESRFLWVIRPDSVTEKNEEETKLPGVLELKEATKEKGYFVEWAPQEEVLSHPAVGGFLTHSGWNSTLECVLEGVPMICWPAHADQPINSRFVDKVWKIGLDMKGTCDRVVIEKMVRELMKDNNDNQFRKKVNEMSQLAKKSVKEGGSSFCNLERLIKDLDSIAFEGNVISAT